jgi:ATP-dependent HslUV protease ATP-binding subunit HslU
MLVETVEQIIRDLIEIAIAMERERKRKEVKAKAELKAEEKVLDSLLEIKHQSQQEKVLEKG